MYILDSALQLRAGSTKTTAEKEIERLVYREGGKTGETAEEKREPGAAVDLSEKAQALIDQKEAGRVVPDDATQIRNILAALDEARKAPRPVLDDLKRTRDEMTRRFLESFINIVFGRKMRFQVKLLDVWPQPAAGDSLPLARGGGGQGSPLPAAQEEKPNDWGVSYERRYERFESEKMFFGAQGDIRTADGREISITLDLRMSRSLYEASYVALKSGGKLLDPLAVNYAAPAAGLTSGKYSFDLDGDGALEQISFLTGGSGFLALDKNGDGKINDGKELFGTQSGDGFKDLAVHDRDGNGWIDEGDGIFSELKLWVKDEKGGDRLLTLAQAGIGAIFLGSADSPIDLVGLDGRKNGQISKTGLFLREDGLAGTAQHVDIAV
ncbi:MAG: hypothetical protein LBO03_02410 [Acidaminococcales bacterium]|jgi:hypothetical protein|nr:hypothetical protein [Acidaminococcales bacterium]